MSDKLTCGIVMPISAIDDCTAEHWAEVLRIVKEAATAAGFDPSLVSDAEESGIIQKRIVSKLYNSDIVVVDVSAKNPNVMFELGMRLAFDKPAIVIKDEKTNYSFDTGIIEHIGYPRDLHYYSILEFSKKLEGKIKATDKAAKTDKNYTTFLKHFGEYTVAGLEKTEVGSSEYVVKAIDELRSEVALLHRRPRVKLPLPPPIPIPSPDRHMQSVQSTLIRSFINSEFNSASEASKNMPRIMEFVIGHIPGASSDDNYDSLMTLVSIIISEIYSDE